MNLLWQKKIEYMRGTYQRLVETFPDDMERVWKNLKYRHWVYLNWEFVKNKNGEFVSTDTVPKEKLRDIYLQSGFLDT